MAFKVKRVISPKAAPNNRAVKEYICDTDAEIANLPKVGTVATQVLNDGEDFFTNEECNYGSEAVVAEPFGGYILNASNEWKKVF